MSWRSPSALVRRIGRACLDGLPVHRQRHPPRSCRVSGEATGWSAASSTSTRSRSGSTRRRWQPFGRRDAAQAHVRPRCVLYLGRAGRTARPLRRRSTTARCGSRRTGTTAEREALYIPHVPAVAARCLDRSDTEHTDPVATAQRIRGRRRGRLVVTWRARAAPDDRGCGSGGHKHLLARSADPLARSSDATARGRLSTLRTSGTARARWPVSVTASSMSRSTPGSVFVATSRLGASVSVPRVGAPGVAA